MNNDGWDKLLYATACHNRKAFKLSRKSNTYVHVYIQLIWTLPDELHKSDWSKAAEAYFILIS